MTTKKHHIIIAASKKGRRGIGISNRANFTDYQVGVEEESFALRKVKRQRALAQQHNYAARVSLEREGGDCARLPRNRQELRGQSVRRILEDVENAELQVWQLCDHCHDFQRRHVRDQRRRQ